jgi:hypothetical protein
MRNQHSTCKIHDLLHGNLHEQWRYDIVTYYPRFIPGLKRISHGPEYFRARSIAASVIAGPTGNL